MTLSVVLRKALVDKLGLTRESPIDARIKALTQLGTIGATGPGAASEQIFKFLVKKAGGIGTILKFVYIGAPELPASLMNNVIDAYALSPPSAEITEPSGKGYVLIPLGKGEVPELTDYPYEVLMVRPDYVEANPKIAMAVARAISRGGALFRSNPEAAKTALRNHRLYTKDKLPDDVFELSYSTVAPAMPALGQHDSRGLAEGDQLFRRSWNRQRSVPRPLPIKRACSGRTNTLASRKGTSADASGSSVFK